jgi:excisionase family DNA binding protein
MKTFELSVEELDSARTLAGLLKAGGSLGGLELSPTVATIVKLVTEELIAGKRVTVGSQDSLMTTQEAADFLNVSRTTLIKLLDEYGIEYTTVGRHRKIAATQVEELNRRYRAKRQDALDRLIDVTEDAQLYPTGKVENPLIRL